jgi:hypothetical protein
MPTSRFTTSLNSTVHIKYCCASSALCLIRVRNYDKEKKELFLILYVHLIPGMFLSAFKKINTKEMLFVKGNNSKYEMLYLVLLPQPFQINTNLYKIW